MRGKPTGNDGLDGTLLDSGGALETVGVDTWMSSEHVGTDPTRAKIKFVSHTAKQLGLQVHGVEGVGDLIVVGLDLSY